MFYNLAGLKSAPTRDEFLTQRMNYNFMGEDTKIVMVVSTPSEKFPLSQTFHINKKTAGLL